MIVLQHHQDLLLLLHLLKVVVVGPVDPHQRVVEGEQGEDQEVAEDQVEVELQGVEELHLVLEEEQEVEQLPVSASLAAPAPVSLSPVSPSPAAPEVF